MDINIIRKNQDEEVLRRNQSGEVEYLTFPSFTALEGIRHMITTRLGGVSGGHLASMNVSYTRGDKKENVDENYRRIAGVLGVKKEAFVFTDQTHTANVRVVTEQDRGKGLTRERDYAEVDGLVTDRRGIVLSAFFADCVPLLFADPVKGAIGLSHSGWKGTVCGIGRATVRTMMREYGSDPGDIIAAIGPSVCRSCYEVGRDVADEFAAVFSKISVKEVPEAAMDRILTEKGGGKFQLDLWEANRILLLEAGLRREHISVTDLCTCCNPQYLFSHRATAGKRGNIGVFLMLEE